MLPWLICKIFGHKKYMDDLRVQDMDGYYTSYTVVVRLPECTRCGVKLKGYEIKKG